MFQFVVIGDPLAPLLMNTRKPPKGFNLLIVSHVHVSFAPAIVLAPGNDKEKKPPRLSPRFLVTFSRFPVWKGVKGAHK